MNKGKLKRIKKELEKLLRAGHYWEWLAEAEKASLGDEYKKEHYEVWQSLVKRALRLPSGFEEFLAKSEGVAQHPDTPDVRLLFLLKNFINEDRINDEMINIKGLSLAAEELRKKALSWEDDFFPEKRIRRLFTLFIKKPHSVTKKHYRDIGSLVKNTSLAQPFTLLEKEIDYIRKLSSKKLAEPDSVRLKHTDSLAKSISNQLSQSIQRIVFHPFEYHVSKYLKGLAEKGHTAEIARTAQALPFLFSLAAGEKAGAIKEQLMHIDSGIVDHPLLLKKLATASFEEKIAFIVKLRSLPKEDYGSDEYSQIIRNLYLDILPQIAKRCELLHEREKRELPKVIGPIILRDLHLLWNSIYDLAEILKITAEASCLDIKLSLLSLMVAKDLLDSRLKEYAMNSLKKLPPPGKGDIAWLMQDFRFLVFPKISSLKPLIDLYGSDAPCVHEITGKILEETEMSLSKHSFMIKGTGLLSLFTQEFPVPFEEVKKEIPTLRRELNTFKDYKTFSVITEYLDCFPENYFTTGGYKRTLKSMYEKTDLGFLVDTFESIIGRSSTEMRMFGGSRLSSNLLEDIVREQENACLDVIKEHWDDLKTAGFKTIMKLFKIITEKYTDGGLLIRLHNILEYRFGSGEKEVGPLRDRVWDLLSQYSRQANKSRGGR